MKITKVETVYDGFYKLRKLTVQDGAQELARERFEPGRAVAALVYDTNKQDYVFVRQFRFGVGEEVEEIAAGMLDKENETPEDALRREIEEELGYAEVDHLEPIVTMYASPGGSAEHIHIYYAEVSHQDGSGGGAEGENENITLLRLPWEEMIARPWHDAKTIIAVQWAQLHRK